MNGEKNSSSTTSGVSNQAVTSFVSNPEENLSNNKAAASVVLISNKERFDKDPLLKTEYSKFIDKYELLNHMSPSINHSGT